ESAVSSQRRGKPAGCRLPHRDVQQPAQSSGLLPSITGPVDVTRNGLPVVNGSRFVTSRLKRPAPCEAMPGLAAIRFATMTLSVSVSSGGGPKNWTLAMPPPRLTPPIPFAAALLEATTVFSSVRLAPRLNRPPPDPAAVPVTLVELR